MAETIDNDLVAPLNETLSDTVEPLEQNSTSTTEGNTKDKGFVLKRYQNFACVPGMLLEIHMNGSVAQLSVPTTSAAPDFKLEGLQLNNVTSSGDNATFFGTIDAEDLGQVVKSQKKKDD